MSKTTEKVQIRTVVLADRKEILTSIQKDLSSSDKTVVEGVVKSLVQGNFDKYMSIEVPNVNERRRKKKVQRYRKTSPYLAFCAWFRDQNRDKSGKLKENVLDITKKAGAKWGSMSEADRKPWEAKAAEISAKEKIKFDKMNASTNNAPSIMEIKGMKKCELTDLANKNNMEINPKMSLKLTREKLVEFYHPSNRPTEGEITKMKKAELQKLIEKVGLESDKDIKSMQTVLISHYSQVGSVC